MAWTEAFPHAALDDRAERALRWPLGAASPLWALFGAAASAGVAWWWMTRWMRPTNIEALAELAAAGVKGSVEAAADSGLRTEEARVAADAAAEGPRPPSQAPLVSTIVSAPAGALAPEPDDLTRMSGIGPKLSAALAAHGVTRFAQIAAWTADDLAAVDAALGLRGRAVREAWVAQAKRLAQG